MAVIEQPPFGISISKGLETELLKFLNQQKRMRRKPVIPKRVHETEKAQKHLETFRMVRAHVAFHKKDLLLSYDRGDKSDGTKRYFSDNFKALAAALEHLAERHWQRYQLYGKQAPKATLREIEAAINVYASSHPTAIRIVDKAGYLPVYHNGRWPKPFNIIAE